jgi:predicted aspartyl protease
MDSEGIRKRKPLLGAMALVALATLRPIAAEPGQPAPQHGPQDDSPVTALPDVTVSAPEPRYVAPTTRDRIGRIWAPVLIDGKGPFRLVLDTGASNSAILPRVAEALGTPISVDSVRLRGVTGTTIASSIRVERLEVGELFLEGATMPIVSDVFGGADGVLGTEGLKDKRIVIEFRRDRITIVRSHRERAPPGYLVVPFKFVDNRGLRIKMSIGGVPAVAVIDTGAQVTVGNLALREALVRRSRAAGPGEEIIIGVTQDIQTADRAQVRSLYAGDLLVRNAEILFTDLHIFEHWQLRSKPAVLIGMDILGVLDTLIIDYRRNELQIRTPR